MKDWTKLTIEIWSQIFEKVALFGLGLLWKLELDGEGPVDNKASSDYLHPFVKKEEEKEEERK